MNSLQYYYDNPALSQSKLKRLLGNSPWNFEKETQKTDSMNIGSAVDCLITHPDDFDMEFYISAAKPPTEKIKAIIDEYYETVKEEKTVLEDKNLLVSIARSRGYQPKWGDDAIFRNIYESSYIYCKEIREAEGRIPITLEQNETVRKVVDNIKENRYINHILNGSRFQVDLYGKIDGIDVKGLIDILQIDHVTNKIRIVDLKTTSENTCNFIYELKKYRYDIQMAFYLELVKQNYREMIENEEMELECYFLVESTVYPGQPILYMCDSLITEIGRYGASEASRNTYNSVSDDNHWMINDSRHIEGYEDLIRKYRYYMDNGFDVSMQVSEKYNNLNLGWYGIEQ